MSKNINLMNNFIGGLKTEYTGLNFPENAATSMDNCVVSIIGDVLRRKGINFELNSILNSINTASSAISYYRWKNAGGDGETEILVLQVGATLYFFQSSESTISNPLSDTLLTSTINLSGFLPSGSSNNPTTIECQYSDGNGYLFVYHPYCDPFYCTFSSGTVTATVITLQIRDFNGIPDGLQSSNAITTRPVTLSNEHNYNLQNQGWAASASWNYNSTTTQSVNFYYGGQYTIGTFNTGNYTFTVSSNTGISNGQAVQILPVGTISVHCNLGTGYTNINFAAAGGYATGIVSNISGNNITVDIQNNVGYFLVEEEDLLVGGAASINSWTVQLSSLNTSQIATWNSDLGNYPSNADIWWLYKDTSNVFDPSTTIGNVTIPTSPAPKGHFILNAFDQMPSSVSSISGLTNISTLLRPQTGCWFQGRVWYTGCNASQAATGDQNYFTWTENIYFSQIVDSTTSPEFGLCYQTNDPTDESFFDILPSDGGVITIQGSGNIYKLFPIQNGLLVFASNGIWFITGSQGIGFTATDYTITKIDVVQSISPYSFINVRGLPVFWNEEGIYMVEPSQSGTMGLSVNPMTVGTILTFYNNIPKSSKAYARGDYDPISYVIQWVYRSTTESGIANRYQFDSALSLNVYNKAFYPYSISSNNSCYINGLVYMNYPPGAVSASAVPEPGFKYLTSVGTKITFSEENDSTTYFDFYSHDNVGVNFTSSFSAGYDFGNMLSSTYQRVKGMLKWQPIYVNMYSRNAGQYFIQSAWDFATSGDSGAYSTNELAIIPTIITYASGVSSPPLTDYGMYYRRHKLRGHGEAFQILVSSVSGQPFDIMGWSTYSNIEQGV